MQFLKPIFMTAVLGYAAVTSCIGITESSLRKKAPRIAPKDLATVVENEARRIGISSSITVTYAQTPHRFSLCAFVGETNDGFDITIYECGLNYQTVYHELGHIHLGHHAHPLWVQKAFGRLYFEPEAALFAIRETRRLQEIF